MPACPEAQEQTTTPPAALCFSRSFVSHLCQTASFRPSTAADSLGLGRFRRLNAHSPPASAANAGGFLQTSLSEVIQRTPFRLAPAITRRITPDRVIALQRIRASKIQISAMRVTHLRHRQRPCSGSVLSRSVSCYGNDMRSRSDRLWMRLCWFALTIAVVLASNTQFHRGSTVGMSAPSAPRAAFEFAPAAKLPSPHSAVIVTEERPESFELTIRTTLKSPAEAKESILCSHYGPLRRRSPPYSTSPSV